MSNFAGSETFRPYCYWLLVGGYWLLAIGYWLLGMIGSNNE